MSVIENAGTAARCAVRAGRDRTL